MLFLTVLLFVYYLIIFLNGGLFKSNIAQVGELRIKLENKEISEKEVTKQIGNLSFKMLGIIIPLFILKLIYMIIALNHKEFALISVGYFVLYILWTFLSMKLSGKKKLDLTKEENIVKYRKRLYRGRTIQGTLWQLISLGYFGYMGYLLLT